MYLLTASWFVFLVSFLSGALLSRAICLLLAKKSRSSLSPPLLEPRADSSASCNGRTLPEFKEKPAGQAHPVETHPVETHCNRFMHGHA